MTVERLADWLANTTPGFFIIAAALLVPFARDVVSRAMLLVGGPGVALVALINAQGLSINLSTVKVLGLELVLYRPDSLSFVFGLAFIIASAIVGVYSLHRRDPLQDSTAMIYAGSAVTAVFVGDLISLFIAWELTAISSVFQVLAPRTRESGRAAMRYLVFQIASGMLVLAGVCMFAAATGETQFALIAPSMAGLPVGVMDISAPGAVLLLAGFGIKAAFPMVHNWLQDAYPKASETGSVVLSAFTTKLAVYALARYFAGLDALIWIGAIMAVFPVFFAVIENDLRKVLSYSLNNQVFMVTVFGIADIGGTIVIHEFGAFFGLACALVYGLPPDTDKVFQGRLSDTFSLLGTIFLWIYWPSFVGGMAVAGSVEQQKAMVNTVLALLASSTVAFAASCLLAPDYKLRCADIQVLPRCRLSIGACVPAT